MIQQIFDKLNVDLETVIASFRDPTDFGGMPIPVEVNGQTEIKLEAPAWAKRTQRSAEKFIKKFKERVKENTMPLISGGVFIDEASCTPPAVQAALLRVILEKWVGEFKLDDTVKFLAAANPPEEAAGGWDMAIPLAGRFVHLQHVAPSVDEWTAWLSGNPNNTEIVELDRDQWERGYSKAKSLAIAYLKIKPSELMEDPSQDEARFPQAYASPRTWDTAIRLYASCIATDRLDLALPLVNGCIGSAIGTMWLSWINENDLPNPEDLLADPDSYEPDTRRPDAVFATMNGVALAVADSKGKYSAAEYGRRFVSAFKVIDRCGQPDKIVLACKSLVTKETRPAKDAFKDPVVKKQIAKLAPVLKAAGLMDSLL